MSGQPLILSIIHGVEGDSVCLGDAPGSGTRIAGPKPWGGGKVKRSWTVDRVALERVLVAETTAAEPAERGEPAGWGEIDKAAALAARDILESDTSHLSPHARAGLEAIASRLLRTPAQPPGSDAKGDLIRIAADLVRMEAPLPSNPEDHHQKTYSAGVVAHAMERHEDALKELAVRVRRVFDKLPPAQPPDERGELCSTCGGSQTVHWGAEDKWQSLPCPNCSPEAKAPAQPPASGEPAEGYRQELVKHCVDAGLPESYVSGSPAATARKIAELDRALSEEIEERDRNAEWADKLAFAIEGLTGVEVGEHSSANNPWRVALEAAESPPPADWREAIVRAVSATVRRVVERLAGSERLDPPATPAEIANLAASDSADEVLSALAPLVLGEKLRAERLRRAATEFARQVEYALDDKEDWSDDDATAIEVSIGALRQLQADLDADPPDAALAELVGLPGKLRKEAGELVRPGLLLYAANLLAEVLAKLGLPAGEGAGDG